MLTLVCCNLLTSPPMLWHEHLCNMDVLRRLYIFNLVMLCSHQRLGLRSSIFFVISDSKLCMLCMRLISCHNIWEQLLFTHGHYVRQWNTTLLSAQKTRLTECSPRVYLFNGWILLDNLITFPDLATKPTQLYVYFNSLKNCPSWTWTRFSLQHSVVIVLKAERVIQFVLKFPSTLFSRN
jgi:hypothetical protein